MAQMPIEVCIVGAVEQNDVIQAVSLANSLQDEFRYSLVILTAHEKPVIALLNELNNTEIKTRR
jgi:hypothetical protein